MKQGNVWTIVRKEFFRFFTDRRLVFTAVLLPGLMIYLLYSFMGDAMMNRFTADESYSPSVLAVNLPDAIAALAEQAGIAIEPAADEAQAQSQIAAMDADLLAVFPADFDQAVAAYAPGQGDAPNIALYYNSASPESSEAFSAFHGLLDAYENALANKFDVNRGVEADLATDRDATGAIFASMLPMLLMVFLFSGCMSVAPESIAGEKERGSIATLLVTPLGRGQLATGKVLSLSGIALLSGTSSFLGTMLSLPKLMGPAAGSLSATAYGPGDYALLFLVIASTVLLLVGMISVLSAFAKSVKEASMMAMPLMIVNMLLGVSAMFGAAKTELAWYFLPLYNSVQCMSGIFSFSMTMPCALATVGSNLVCAGLMTLLLRRLFNSEKVMFAR